MPDGTEASFESASWDLLSGLQFGWCRRLPVILQTEAAECGLACLAMIARYHGHDVDLPGLRRRFSISLKGMDLSRVMSMASELGFVVRPLRLEIGELRQLQMPCLMHWDLNHFVVLKKTSVKGVVIHDPAAGDLRLSLQEVSEHFTGVALELMPSVSFEPVKERQAVSLHALTGSIRGWLPALVQIFMLAMALEVFALIGPFYLQWVLDQVLVSDDRDLMTLLAVGFGCVVVLQTLITAARSWAVMTFGVRISVQWSANIIHHLLKLPLDWYEKRHIGDITSRLSSAGKIQHTLTLQVIGTILDGLMAMASLVVMSLYSMRLTFVVVGLFITYGVLRWVFFTPLRRANEDNIVYAARQQSELLQIIRGAMSIKLANQEGRRSAGYIQKLIDTASKGIAIKRLSILFASINQILFGLGHVVLIWMAALLVLNGQFSTGMLMAFISYSGQFTSRVGALIDTLVEFRMLGLHTERIADIVLCKPEENIQTGHQNMPTEAVIEVRNLGFQYANNEQWILRNCSFCVSSGECMEIVGPSGCGKTTLAKLLLGLLEPTEGEIMFGGVNIRHLGLISYRKMVGAVMQNDQLFTGSIIENISFFDPHPNISKVEKAASMAAVHEEIISMPMGYESLVGDMGSVLSGGQKQRVMLARAFYRCPRFLVLDEATCHLDEVCQDRVINAINDSEITRVIIAHNKITCGDKTNMFVMPSGEV